MEIAEYELGQAQNGNSWLDGWNELKEVARTATWETFEAKLSKEQQEIVRLIGKFYAFYGLEEPNTEALYHGAWTLVQGRRKRNV